MHLFKFISLSILLLIFVGCSKDKTEEVTLYTTVDQIFSEPILRDFEDDTGIKVKAIYDTEETKSTGILNRLIAEKDNPHCDLFWSGDPIRAIILKNRGITTGYDSPVAKGIPLHFVDSDMHWIGFSARARVLIYNKKLLKAQDAPKSIFHLINSKYKDNFTIANPLFGTTSFHFASWFSYLGDAKAKALIQGFKDNGVVISSSNGDVKRRVIKGEVSCGLTDTDDAFEAIKESKDIGIVFLDQDGMGTLVMPNTLLLIKNSPQNENGKKLIDYLLSKSTEEKLAKSCSQMPLHKGVKTPKSVPSLDTIVSMDIDYGKTATKLEGITKELKEWVVE